MMIIESLDVVMSSHLGLDEGMALRRPDTQHEHGPRHRPARQPKVAPPRS